MKALKRKAKREPTPTPQTQTRPEFGMISLAGRASVAELILHAAEASNATGVGRILTFTEGSAERR